MGKDGALMGLDTSHDCWHGAYNIGNWYPLGGERWVVWDRKQMPAGVTMQHPVWSDVLARGPVTLLCGAGPEAYLMGWRAGRRDLWQVMEATAEEDPPGGGR
jgi:hypothetical protein